MKGINDLFGYLASGYYNIGFVQKDMNSILNHGSFEVKWLVHNDKDTWFADPFILDYDENSIAVLVEEWDNGKRKGQISKLIVDRSTCELVKKETVLELDTHLSFPAYHVKNGVIHLYPENSSSGALYSYEYDPVSNRCVSKTLLIDQPATDAVLLEFEGREFIFATLKDDNSGNGKVLNIYERKGDNPFELIDTFGFEENIARMAGNYFEYKGKLYRPAQESNHSYGHSVSIQEASLHNDKWHFKEVVRLSSPNKQLSYGFHTFNVYKDIIAVDAFGWRYPLLRHLFVDYWGNVNSMVRVISKMLKKEQ